MPILSHYYAPRPVRAPADKLPFGVRSMGFYKLQPPYASIDKKMPSVQVFWCTQGAGIIEINAQRHVLKHHQIALYFPGMRHYYYTANQPWAFYWLTLDGPLAVTLPATMKLEARVYDAGPAPAALFRALRRTIVQPSKQAELRSCTTAFTILLHAAGYYSTSADNLVKSAVEFMRQRYASPELNIKTLADLMGVPRATLHARFQAAMGMPPSAYLHRLRIQNALELLQHTQLSMGTIARQCGHPDVNYFSRLIHHVTGESPTQYRQNHQPVVSP